MSIKDSCAQESDNTYYCSSNIRTILKKSTNTRFAKNADRILQDKTKTVAFQQKPHQGLQYKIGSTTARISSTSCCSFRNEIFAKECPSATIALQDNNKIPNNSNNSLTTTSICCAAPDLAHDDDPTTSGDSIISPFTSKVPPIIKCQQSIVAAGTGTSMQKPSDTRSICVRSCSFKFQFSSIFLTLTICLGNVILHKRFLHLLIIILLSLSRLAYGNALLVVEPTFVTLSSDSLAHVENDDNIVYKSTNRDNIKSDVVVGGSGASGGGVILTYPAIGSSGAGSAAVAASGYLDKLDNLERSVAEVLIKVAYGTTSTTKRSIPDNGYVPSLTTIATPLLTTLRYMEKSPHQQQLNFHHRNYELDLERDHALPTSAPNADILKSNSNPTYPNPNRHHNHDRERHRHLLNSTPLPSLPNILKKSNGQSPTIPMYPGDIPSYSPPARSFFTPPLPPEYQNPFADKPILRGTNNEDIIANTGTYINRRPIPPPSLMPGHERIPFRPPDIAASTGGSGSSVAVPANSAGNPSPINSVVTLSANTEADRKKALNTPSRGFIVHSSNNDYKNNFGVNGNANQQEAMIQSIAENQQPNSAQHSTRKEILPSIKRILSGELPDVLLKQVTFRPAVSYHQPPSSPVVLVDNTSEQNEVDDDSGSASISNINKSKDSGVKIDQTGGGTVDMINGGGEPKVQLKTKMSKSSQGNGPATVHSHGGFTSTPSASVTIGESSAAATSTSTTTSATKTNSLPTLPSSSPSSSSSSTSSTAAAAAAAHATWTIAWNVHVYLSVILFTILSVYSFYKMLTYNKLTHLFSQSYFVCIHLILIIICTARIFYLCYDAYNIHSSFHIFVSEILLNLPATFLTISFSVLILFLFLKSLNHKNNRYSALIRPLTVVVGCGVHVILCITLHYVESYTMQNHQQHLYFQQQQQMYRRQQQQQHQTHPQYSSANLFAPEVGNGALHSPGATTNVASTPPPRVLSLICQIIYIFICLSLGLLYLYLYRILKRILRSKSQNYIHGYQNLSYAIHITIATALLFVLLAALQIFGAISISTTRSLITQVTAEIDWLHWGYQFSLRLIEIAIITLISWVAGLKTSGGGGNVSVGNGNSRLGAGASGDSGVFGSGTAGREKQGGQHHNHHSNVTNFFLPCTSSSSQEQFDTDYPAVCNANTNLHTYTMRTGKLIYDDSFALNSLATGGQTSQMGGNGRSTEFQLQQQPAYQRPYDTGSLHSTANHNVADYGPQATIGSRYHHHDLQNHQYADYLTDATTDHYENPNFDLRGPSVTMNTMQKFAKTSTASTTASISGGSGSSAASQQQMLLLQSDTCYSEPLQAPNCNIASSSNYDFNNFERPKFGGGSNQPPIECWSDQHVVQPMSRTGEKRERKSHTTTLERSAYENPERRSSNSTQSCISNGGGGRYASYSSFERGHYCGGVRKSGTLNNIVSGSAGGGGGNVAYGRNASTSSAASSNISTMAPQRTSGIQTLAASDRHNQNLAQQHHSKRNGRAMTRGVVVCSSGTVGSAGTRDHDVILGHSVLERTSGHALQQQQQNFDDDMMLSGSSVERTNLIDNEDGSCITNSSSTVTSGGNLNDLGHCINTTNTDRLLKKGMMLNNTTTSTSMQRSNLQQIPNSPQQQARNTNHSTNSSSGHDDSVTSSSSSIPGSTTAANGNGINGTTASGNSMLVAEHGFVRFRALDDINNAQGVGIHNASIRNPNRSSNAATAPPTTGKTALQCAVAQNP